MSASSQSSITHTSHAFVSASLPETARQEVDRLLDMLLAESADPDMSTDHAPLNIAGFVDGRGLSCPMPLLKTKVALRNITGGESLYVVATDANSQADISAFCRQNQQANSAQLILNHATHQHSADCFTSQHVDTIYHFIITKTDSN